MFQYHKAIFIQNSLGKISTSTYWKQLLNLSNPEKSMFSAGKLFHITNYLNAEKIASIKAETSLFV